MAPFLDVACLPPPVASGEYEGSVACVIGILSVLNLVEIDLDALRLRPELRLRHAQRFMEPQSQALVRGRAFLGPAGFNQFHTE